MLCGDGGREVWDVMDSSSDGMMCGGCCVSSDVIVDGMPECVAIVLELGGLGSM